MRHAHAFGFRLSILFLIIAKWFFLASSLPAQQAGHYVGGVSGLENGTTPPPGFYATFLPYVNHVNSIKGPEGHTVINVDLNVVANMPIYAMTMPWKVLGGTYGWMFIIPVVNTRFVANEFNASAASAGLSDLFFAPVVLGWTKGNADFTVNYGFYPPSGDFNSALPLNPGLGFFEHQIQAGSTYSVGKAKLWNASLLTSWEINQTNNFIHIKPGPMFTGEYGIGRRFFKEQMNAGVSGFAYHKLAADTGSGVNPLVRGVLDRQFGIGPEYKYTALKWHLGFDVRVQQQFAVQAKTQGPVFVLSITYLDIFPPPKH